MMMTLYSSTQTNHLLARRHRSSWNAPSSVSPGVLLVHVLAGVGPWVIKGKLNDQPDGLDHGLNPLESSSR